MYLNTMKALLVIFFVYFYLIVGSYLFPAQKTRKRPASKTRVVLVKDSASGQLYEQKAVAGRP